MNPRCTYQSKVMKRPLEMGFQSSTSWLIHENCKLYFFCYLHERYKILAYIVDVQINDICHLLMNKCSFGLFYSFVPDKINWAKAVAHLVKTLNNKIFHPSRNLWHENGANKKRLKKRNVQQKLWIKCPWKREEMSMKLQELADGHSVEKDKKTVILQEKEKNSPNQQRLVNLSANN